MTPPHSLPLSFSLSLSDTHRLANNKIYYYYDYFFMKGVLLLIGWPGKHFQMLGTSYRRGGRWTLSTLFLGTCHGIQKLLGKDSWKRIYYFPYIIVFLRIIPHAQVAEGIMFLTRPSVSQSVSPVFLVSATPLKPLNRISWNFVVMKDIMCRCAYPQEILIPLFFSELRHFWT